MNHLSIRLPWHDQGWSGCVCGNPSGNCYCKGSYSISAEKIRQEKDDVKEETLKGQNLDPSWSDYYPPCSETINTFGEKAINHTFTPRDFILNTSAKTISMPPNSTGTWSFEGMWDRDTQRHLPPNERLENARTFFNEVKKFEKTALVFYYCNYDNPVSGDDKKYALAGIARIKKVHLAESKEHPFLEWDDIPKDMEAKYGRFIWSCIIENDPAERIRLPYQEYIGMGKDPGDFAVFPEGELSKSFKYGAHHVSDDDAISIIDMTIVAVKKIIEQKYLEEKTIETWEKSLEWLRAIRRECWVSRGLYPGLVPVLRYLGLENPEEFIRRRLPPDLPKEKIKDYFFDRFEGKVQMGSVFDKPLERASGRFKAMMGSDTEAIKAKLCRDKLPFIALDEDQIENILGDHMVNYCISSSLDAIYDNPYIISEEYLGVNTDDFINFEKIDHGMIPEEIPEFENAQRIPLDDWRRLRALMHTILKEASSQGHTFLEWPDLSEKVNNWHQKYDKGNGLFHFDWTAWEQNKTNFEPKVTEDRAAGLTAIYLTKLHDAERILSKNFIDLLKDGDVESANIVWKDFVETDNNSNVDKAIKERVVNDQIMALKKLYSRRLSVLTGTAGTGKTTIIKTFIKGICSKQARHDFLVLAPTGKASLILKNRINDSSVHVMTIHSYLVKNNWINYTNFSLREKGQKNQFSTVIVDECSMIDTMLFCTLIRALDIGNIERLVLSGDYNQLPPIGPGKVFYDLIQYLKSDEDRTEKHLAELHFNWRQARGSQASRLAHHYARTANKADEDVFSGIESGVYDISNSQNNSDLILDYWEDDEDLLNKLPNILDFALTKLDVQSDEKPLGEKYNEAHGIAGIDGIAENQIDNKKIRIEAINIIAPYRHTPSGVDNLNREVQKILRGKEIVENYVYYDKIMQIQNNIYSAWDNVIQKFTGNKENGKYVPNGTLGFVYPKESTEKGKWNKIWGKFPDEYGRYSFFISDSDARKFLELGYATSVHKAQGSQFNVTIMIIPEESGFLNREMLYTALTRATDCQIILIQKDISLLKSRLWLGCSDIAKRNSSLFGKSFGIPSGGFEKYKPENLICEALPDLFVRSKGEATISKALADAEIQFYYEKPLIAKDGKSFKLPDFTFKYNRKEYYWEHKGMMEDFDYAQRDEKKTRWYIENGYQDTLIETPLENMNLEDSIKDVFEKRLGL